MHQQRGKAVIHISRIRGHPEGRLSVADLTRCVSILISSGSDWSNRTKRLAARAYAELEKWDQAYEKQEGDVKTVLLFED